MSDLKRNIEKTLIANIIKNTCAEDSGLIFSDSWSSQDRVIRFTTPRLRSLIPQKANGTGTWETGDSVMYEVHNHVDLLEIQCVLSYALLPKKERMDADRLCRMMGVFSRPQDNKTVLRTWLLQSDAKQVNALLERFKSFLSNDLPSFENSLKTKNQIEQEEQRYWEGKKSLVKLSRYERNRKAREMCLAVKGTSCAVCGTNFGKKYGPEFEGMIEVHHIVPISEIGEEYTVDPVKDLVPVCPNCHLALHSKKDGVYTVEELKEMYQNACSAEKGGITRSLKP